VSPHHNYAHHLSLDRTKYGPYVYAYKTSYNEPRRGPTSASDRQRDGSGRTDNVTVQRSVPSALCDKNNGRKGDASSYTAAGSGRYTNDYSDKAL